MQGQRFHALIDPFIDAAERPGKFGGCKIRSVLLGLLSEGFADEPAEKREADLSLDWKRMKKVTSFFYRHHQQWPSSRDLADQVHLSHDYFSRRFKKATGLSPRSWMARERIRLAAIHLIESNCNVSEVAQAFGYSNVFFFSQQFKDIMHQSPTDYQKQRRNG